MEDRKPERDEFDHPRLKSVGFHNQIGSLPVLRNKSHLLYFFVTSGLPDQRYNRHICAYHTDNAENNTEIIQIIQIVQIIQRIYLENWPLAMDSRIIVHKLSPE